MSGIVRMASVAAIVGALCLARSRPKRAMRILRAALTVSLGTTLGLLVWQGRWAEALPLHLCSLSALAALALAFGAGQGMLDFLWYLGVPGALLALIFPAPAVSRCQALLDASYIATHALIVTIPLACLASGRRVRRGQAARMFWIMQGIAVPVYAVNRALGTDFLFLMAPPMGTPLEIAYAWGYPSYILTLECLLLALLGITGGLIPRFCAKWMK